jgi:hypothetical protein
VVSIHVSNCFLFEGSNCIIIENGNIPPYEKCLGCDIPEAMNCVNDMRTNVTGNVPPGCMIRALGEEYDPSCCPRYGKKTTDKFFETMAYPFALGCLKRVGCGDTEVSPLHFFLYYSVSSVRTLFTDIHPTP